MTDKQGGRVVFVGNIPYDQTEEQIMDIFQSVGPVVNFRFVFDKETGRPKGYGFVEYHDAETAASAVRNLNNYELSNRTLRVDFSHESSVGPNILTSRNPAPSSNTGTTSAASAAAASPDTLPPLPPGVAPAPNLSTPEAISSTLSAFTPQQMLSILQELKTVVQTNPAKARELLRVSPQLSYAVVQSMLLMGLVDATAVAKAVDPSQLANQQAQQQARATSTPPPPQVAAVTTQVPAQAAPQRYPTTGSAYPGVPYSASPVNKPSTPVPLSTASMDPQKAALIKQVMDLTEEQIAALPLQQRQPIEVLRERIRNGEF
ncbi:hypothetical protein V1511DRAFT_502657 [Dipodascopsis uninucleata]